MRVGEVLEVVAGGEGAAGAREHHGTHGAIVRRLAQMGDHASYIAPVIAFFLSGRSMVIVATP